MSGDGGPYVCAVGFLGLQPQSTWYLRSLASPPEMHSLPGSGCEPLSEVWLLCGVVVPHLSGLSPLTGVLQRPPCCTPSSTLGGSLTTGPCWISPLPGSQPRPEASVGLPQCQASLVTCPAPQLQLMAAETQGKLPAAKYRPKLRRPEGFGQGPQSALPPA